MESWPPPNIGDLLWDREKLAVGVVVQFRDGNTLVSIFHFVDRRWDNYRQVLSMVRDMYRVTADEAKMLELAYPEITHCPELIYEQRRAT